MSKKLVVFAATGSQGSSVATTLAKDGWEVVGFTRDPSKEASKALEAQGITMVKTDASDPSTYASYLKGADAVFVNNDFWGILATKGGNGHAAAETETAWSIAAIEAADKAGVKHILYSTLDGDNGVDHWESKQNVTKWAKQQGIPITNVYGAFYFENLVRFHMIQKNDDGTFTFGLPAPDSSVVPGFPASQSGLWVKVAVNDPVKWKGKDMYLVTDMLTLPEMAAALSEASGKTVKTLQFDKNYFESDAFKKQLGEDFWVQWNLFYLDILKRDVPASRSLVSGAWTFKDWAKHSIKELGL